MKVAVHLTATLRAYLPPGTPGDSVVLDVPAGTTVDQVIHSLRIPSELERLTVVNGRDVTPDQALAEGDVLSVFPPLAGGR
ncbi:MAG TPA: MoaD/ThiS family protein [Methylomirabilota bacterium]|nr:MoaD/ThiS family protein [Methylomirabilota bacterium]